MSVQCLSKYLIYHLKKKMHGKHAETANTAALKTFNLPFLHSSLVGLNLFEVKK